MIAMGGCGQTRPAGPNTVPCMYGKRTVYRTNMNITLLVLLRMPQSMWEQIREADKLFPVRRRFGQATVKTSIDH